MNNLDYYNFDSNCNSGSTLDSIINGLPLDDLADALLSNANNPNNQFTYYVYDKYEVKEDDLSPISDNKLFCELTLITCNNFNNNRLIIKAKTGSLQ